MPYIAAGSLIVANLPVPADAGTVSVWFLWIAPAVIVCMGIWGACSVVGSSRRLGCEFAALEHAGSQTAGAFAESLDAESKPPTEPGYEKAVVPDIPPPPPDEPLVKRARRQLLQQLRGCSSQADLVQISDMVAAELDERIAAPRTIAAASILVGLLGTVSGLAATVWLINRNLVTQGPGDSSDPTEALNRLIPSLGSVLEHSGLAFVSAGTGVVVSLFLSWAIASYGRKAFSFERKLSVHLMYQFAGDAESYVGVPSFGALLSSLEKAITRFSSGLPDLTSQLLNSANTLKSSVNAMAKTNMKVDESAGVLYTSAESLNANLRSVRSEVELLAGLANKIATFHSEWGAKSEAMFDGVAAVGITLVEQQRLLADSAQKIQEAAYDSLKGVRDVVATASDEQRRLLEGFRDALAAQQAYSEEVLRKVSDIPAGVAAGRLLVTDNSGFENLRTALERLTDEVRAQKQPAAVREYTSPARPTDGHPTHSVPAPWQSDGAKPELQEPQSWTLGAGAQTSHYGPTAQERNPAHGEHKIITRPSEQANDRATAVVGQKIRSFAAAAGRAIVSFFAQVGQQFLALVNRFRGQ